MTGLAFFFPSLLLHRLILLPMSRRLFGAGAGGAGAARGAGAAFFDLANSAVGGAAAGTAAGTAGAGAAFFGGADDFFAFFEGGGLGGDSVVALFVPRPLIVAGAPRATRCSPLTLKLGTSR